MMAEAGFGLRPARGDEYAFAEATYIDTMRPLMLELGCWNESQRRAAFRRSYKRDEITIVTRDGKAIGWMQISERDTDFNLAQIQVLEPYRGRGIGTRLINGLLERARGAGKTVSLSAVRINRAIGLYERLGFRIVDADASPILDMVWEARR